MFCRGTGRLRRPRVGAAARHVGGGGGAPPVTTFRVIARGRCARTLDARSSAAPAGSRGFPPPTPEGLSPPQLWRGSSAAGSFASHCARPSGMAYSACGVGRPARSLLTSTRMGGPLSIPRDHRWRSKSSFPARLLTTGDQHRPSGLTETSRGDGSRAGPLRVAPLDGLERRTGWCLANSGDLGEATKNETASAGCGTRCLVSPSRRHPSTNEGTAMDRLPRRVADQLRRLRRAGPRRLALAQRTPATAGEGSAERGARRGVARATACRSPASGTRKAMGRGV